MQSTNGKLDFRSISKTGLKKTADISALLSSMFLHSDWLTDAQTLHSLAETRVSLAAWLEAGCWMLDWMTVAMNRQVPGEGSAQAHRRAGAKSMSETAQTRCRVERSPLPRVTRDQNLKHAQPNPIVTSGVQYRPVAGSCRYRRCLLIPSSVASLWRHVHLLYTKSCLPDMWQSVWALQITLGVE